MRTPIVVPEFAVGAEAVRVSCWLVETGDEVAAGECVVELLTRGITFDVSTPVAGTLVAIDKPLDSELRGGDTLGWVDEEEGEDTA